MPLMHEHRILAQVAGYHTELIKFLPPINIAEEDLEYFLSAMQKVLDGLQRGSRERLGNGAVRWRRARPPNSSAKSDCQDR